MIGFFAPARKAAAVGFGLAVGLCLAACNPPAGPGEPPRAATFSLAAPQPGAAPAAQARAQAEPAPPRQPLKPYEMNARCWMKYDQTKVSLDAKAKLVDKCVEALTKAQGGAGH